MLRRKRFKLVLFTSVVLITLCACASLVVYMQDEQISTENNRAVVGRIALENDTQANTRVYLWEEDESGKPSVKGVTHPEQGGLFAFLFGANRIPNLFAYRDSNVNGRYDAGEPAWSGRVGIGESADGASSVPEVLPIAMSTSHVHNTVLESLSLTTHLQGQRIPIVFGEVAGLDDSRLQAQYGTEGLWLSRTALTQRGLGVYFLETFSPARIPVIFVHGAAGSAQDFQTIITSLRSEHHQAWIFSYPSGLPLDVAADALARMTAGLAQQYDVDRVHVVAHSMGGLIASAALATLDSMGHGALVDRFVTASTPFGGHEAAALGVEHSPITVSAWKDIRPDSAFLQAIAETPLPQRHLLLYGEAAKRNLTLPKENDGTVSVASQLHSPVRDRADIVLGFDLGHRGILTAEEVVAQINKYLH